MKKIYIIIKNEKEEILKTTNMLQATTLCKRLQNWDKKSMYEIKVIKEK